MDRRLPDIHDAGEHWGDVEYLPCGILGPIRCKPITLSEGDLAGTSVEAYKTWTAWMNRSTDLGKTWQIFGRWSTIRSGKDSFNPRCGRCRTAMSGR